MRPETAPLTIGRRTIGPGAPLFVIAEIGLNHGGSLDRALRLVDAAAEAGADAVKLQTIFADELVAPSCPAPTHVSATSLVEFFGGFELDEPAHRALAARARAHGLALLATPFSERAIDLLVRIGVDAFKIASGDLTWHQLIRRAAATGKPVILSTGLATVDETAAAVAEARAAGAGGLAILHCVSAYPVPPGDENLAAIDRLGLSFDVPVGLSDHATDTFAVPMAVALGAAIYERHLVLDLDDEAVDRAVSSSPAELATAIRHARRAHRALGTGEKTGAGAEAANRLASRRSLWATAALPAGHVITEGDLVALRPETGLPASALSRLIGQPLVAPIGRGEPIRAAHLGAALRRQHAS